MEQERPLKERLWELTKDFSVKVSRKAEKHWKINTLRVEIASIKHRINVKCKELGRYVYDQHKSGELETEEYNEGHAAFIADLEALEEDIAAREARIEELELEHLEYGDSPYDPPPPPPPAAKKEAPASSLDETEAAEESAEDKPAETEKPKLDESTAADSSDDSPKDPPKQDDT